MRLTFELLACNLLCGLAFILNIEAATNTSTDLPGPAADSVYWAGEADGKTFWAVLEDSHLDWERAAAGCTRHGKKFAEIRSVAQAIAIHKTYDNYNLPCCTYWVAARDKLDLSQFIWDTSNSEVSATPLSLAGEPKKYGCLHIKVDSAEFLFAECNGSGSTPTRAYICEDLIP